MKFTDLIFDLYGTLVDIHAEETADVWQKTADYLTSKGAILTGNQLQIAFEAQLQHRKVIAGQSYECFPDIPFEEIFFSLLSGQNIQEDLPAVSLQASQLFRIASTEYIRLYANVKESLLTLRKKGFRLWLLSNAQKVFTDFELAQLGLADAFDGIYISSSFGFRKPDRRFFDALIIGENLDPKNCLMIGNDRQTDIAGAKNAGIATLYLHTNLTPSDQAAAQPFQPGLHMEFEGCNWNTLTQLLCR